MDSLTQIVLGASVSVAVMGKRTPAWKAALWGGIAGTLPDLDVFIRHGDPVLDMVLHRAESHAPFWQTLFSIPFAAFVVWLHKEQAQWRHWWLALWLGLVTHPLLDVLTSYGTQLGLPFTNYPYAVSSVFIIDPMVTLPWFFGVYIAVKRKGDTIGLRANKIGFSLGCTVLALGVGIQAHVKHIAHGSLQALGVQAEQMLVTPAPFTMLLWRVVVMDDDHYYEGFRSVFDRSKQIHFDKLERGTQYEPALAGLDRAQRIQAFSRGFYKLHENAVGELIITDIRMGHEPHYTFGFVIARRSGLDYGDTGDQENVYEEVLPAQRSGSMGNPKELFVWLGKRIVDEDASLPKLK